VYKKDLDSLSHFCVYISKTILIEQMEIMKNEKNLNPEEMLEIMKQTITNYMANT